MKLNQENKLRDIQILKPHIALNVRDVKVSTEFYKKMFGIEPVKVRTGYAKFDLDFPALNFTLNETGILNSSGALSHLGIQLESTDDVLRTRDSWLAAGLTVREEEQTTCCYAVQDKAWVKDPDGNEWEAFTILEDNLPEFKFQDEKVNACCSGGACN